MAKKKYPKNRKSRGPHSKETREKISQALKGKPKSLEHIEKNRQWHIGKPAPFKGSKHTPEARRKMSEARTGKFVGEKSSSWKGGRSKKEKLFRCMPEYKEWRTSVFERDDYTCQECGERGGYLTVHHIKPFIQIVVDNDLNDVNDARECLELWDESNGVVLCEECHIETDSYGGAPTKRTVWQHATQN